MKDLCRREGLGLTCRAEYLADDVRVINWKKKGNKKENKTKEDEAKIQDDGSGQ